MTPQEWVTALETLEQILTGVSHHIYYTDLAKELQGAMQSKIAWFRTGPRDEKLHYLLGDLLEQNYENGDELLSARVWNKRLNSPGPGFAERCLAIGMTVEEIRRFVPFSQ